MEMISDVQKVLVFMLMIVVNPLPGVSGLNITDTNVKSCNGTGANIPFSVDLQTGYIFANSESWFYESTLIATNSTGVFSPEVNYTSRLHSSSSYGLTLDNVTDFDKGRYFFVFSYFSPIPQGLKTATATLFVKVTPSESCVPSYRQDGASAICELNSTANCGSPSLVPIWTNTSGNNFTVINPGNYTCCATGSILMDCYRGSSSFCRTFDVAVSATSTGTTVSATSAGTTVSATSAGTTVSATSAGTTGNNNIGLVGLSAIPVVAALAGYALYRFKKKNPADGGSEITTGDKNTNGQQSKTTDNGQETHENTQK